VRSVRFSSIAFSFVLTSALAGALFLLIPLPRPLFPADYSTVIEDRNGEFLRVYLNGNEQWILPPDTRTVPVALKTSVLQFEDRYFYLHGGVNPLAVVRAGLQNVRAGERVSGASTITMQLARIIKPKPRTIASKLLEMAQAVKLEVRFSKEQILESYLNHAPYGGNVRGYRAASRLYFGRSPEQLTWAQAATLAVLPNAPGLVAPQTDPAALRTRRDTLLARLHGEGIIDSTTYRLARAEPVPEKRLTFPSEAPHLADYVKARPARDEDPFVIATTVDRDIQRTVSHLAAFHARFLASQGIPNLAVVVAETATGKVRAYIGSADYFDLDHHGPVDGVQAPRSTGSLLKPFLYALAMDSGMILPQTQLPDIPSQFGAFTPQNPDLGYRGLVTVHDALVMSLNVPPVRLLHRYGLKPFYGFLKDAGLGHLFRTPEDYGLPLILGGAEATPFEITALFRGLGSGGSFAPLQVIRQTDTARPRERELLSPGASYLTLEILQEVVRPGSEAFWASFRHGFPIAWKTGTSYGQRDAWAVGVTPEWTVCVWTGDFTGAENANLHSTTSSGPLLFDIFNSLPRAEGWFSPQQGSLRPVELCLDTGYRATQACPQTAVAYAPRYAPPTPACPYHTTVYVTSDGTYRVNSRCWEPGGYRAVSRLVYPPEIAGYLRSRGHDPGGLPPFAPGCNQSTPDQLSILYPENDAMLYLPRDLDGSVQHVTLRAAHALPDATLFWYIDTEYRGATTGKHVQAVTLREGWHQLEVVDQDGNSRTARFFVATAVRGTG